MTFIMLYFCEAHNRIHPTIFASTGRAAGCQLSGPCWVQGKAFAATGHVMRSMEAVAVAVSQQEPVLLVGETGTGKTTLVQHLAEQV